MPLNNYLEQNYLSHPAFSFLEMPFSIDALKIDSFERSYRLISSKSLDFEHIKSKIINQFQEVFLDLKLQVSDQYELLFLEELQSLCLELLKSEINFYASLNKKKYMLDKKYIDKVKLKSDRFFFGKLSSTFVSNALNVSSTEIEKMRLNASRGLVTREELSINKGAAVNYITKALNREFKALGVLDEVSSYVGKEYIVGGAAIELSVPQASWWRDKLNMSAPPKTMYAHLDESIIYPKAIVYLTNVSTENGPTSCYPEIYEDLKLNPLQEIIGRVISNVGSQENSELKGYYDFSYHQPMTSERFRRHFMKLPPELRFNSHSGWDIVPGTDLESKFAGCENKLLGDAGTFIAFDGARLFHRGGLLDDGERIVLQVGFVPVVSKLTKIISLPNRAKLKIRNFIK